MRKSADVVIRRQQSTNYNLLYPSDVDWDAFVKQKADKPFSDGVVEYLNALSASLLKDYNSRLYPDVVTFAFFCRKANLLKLKEQFMDNSVCLGRGILFHIAPGNVPVNFGYTFVVGLLAGNNNVVRVSSKNFPQVDIIIRHIKELAVNERYIEVAKRLVLVKYDRTSDASAFFSSFADVRVIWGGDATIASIRKNELPPRSFDVCFADRYSIAAIHPDAILAASDSDIKKLAEDFYNDTYLFDQNACSAPHLIFWQKNVQLAEAKGRFWSTLHELVKKKYKLQAVLSVDKLMAFCRQAVCMDVEKNAMPDNYIVRAQLKELPKNIDAFRCAGGYFSEYDIDSLDEISLIISRRYQTLAYYGFDQNELTDFVERNSLSGLDRIVPVGKTTEFSLNWDGNNLLKLFSRNITII